MAGRIGASEVFLSPDVALTLLRTGSIKDNDWLPSKTFRFADGSTAKSERFLIRKLIIGNQTLTNIEANIANSIEAPMLIGQNVMKRLGIITIDHKNQLLIINLKNLFAKHNYGIVIEGDSRYNVLNILISLI